MDAIAILERAPTPYQGRSVSRAQIVSALRKGGRERNLETKAAEIQACLRAPQIQPPPEVTQAYGRSVTALVRLLRHLNQELVSLEKELGDDRTRFANPKARKNYAGTSPITRASGRSRVVLARFVGNRRLTDACHLWAYAALRPSPGARRYYDALRARGQTHNQALRAVANRLVGILHGCLRHSQPYREEVAWPLMEAAA